MKLSIVTTYEEQWCLAPLKKIKQIENELNLKADVLCVHKGDTHALNDLIKEKDVAEKEIFLIETKDRDLIDIVEKHSFFHTGECRSAIALDDDKAKLKDFLTKKHISVPKGFVCDKNADVFSFAYPCFIKPADCEDSIGIDESSVCRTPEEAQKTLEKFKPDNKILVEEYLTGEEYTVAVVKTNVNCYSIFPVRMDMPANKNGDRFLGYVEKLGDDCKLLTDFSKDKEDELRRLAYETFKAVGAKNYARLDIRDDSTGVAKVMEVNLYAGLGIDGYLADCYRAYRLTYKQMLLDVLNTSKLK